MRLHQPCECAASRRVCAAQARTLTLRQRAPRPTPHAKRRAGVVLLVVMVLLALMSLMGLTLVLVTSQGRLSALATSRKGLQVEHDNQELASVITQVAAGSTDPNSSLGAHGLLEDLYGLPQFFGRIMPGTPILPVGETPAAAALLSGNNNGTLVQFTIVPAQLTGAAGLGPQTASQFVLPQYSGAFCGQVITMLTGPAAGQSARVVGYYFNPSFAVITPGGYAVIQASSFGGVVPEPGDEFMINGRPFSGTGFGLNLALFQTPVTGFPWLAPGSLLPTSGNLPLLSATESIVPVNPQSPSLMPYAYLPNHARIALSAFAPTGAGIYWDAAGPGGANEPYDAPDFQNLMLAMHYWSPFLLPTAMNGTPSQVGVITPIPSLHRPELVAWYYNQALVTANPGISMGNPSDGNGGLTMLNTRRKVILRPEPTDNYFHDTNGNNIWDAREPWHDVNGNGLPDDVYADGTPAFLDLNGDGAWTAGETDYAGNTFNPVTGCWYIAQNGAWALDTKVGLDVDNDADGLPDSIWVDAGLPVHIEADGTTTKNLVAILCIDLDGKVNLNAHGTLAQLDSLRYSGGSLNGPLANGAGTDFLYSDLFQRKAPIGQGHGPADVNPLHVFVRSHSPANLSAAGTPVTPTYSYSIGTTSATLPAPGTIAPIQYYKAFLQGFNFQTFLSSYNGYLGSGVTPPVLQVDGRYGESARITVPGFPGFSFAGVYPPGSYFFPGMTPPISLTNRLLNGPRAGWSQWFDTFSTSFLPLNALGQKPFWVNDPVALARFSDVRPHLLDVFTPPPVSSGAPWFSYTPFYFDFLPFGGTLTLPSGTLVPTGPMAHVPTAHGTPSDLHSRGILVADIAGRPYYGGTGTFPWQTLPTLWYAGMTDYAIKEYTVGDPPLPNEYVLNEAVDTQYEMDLTQNARQGGQNTGNSIQGIPDFASVDAKLTPSELEGLLRANEQSASGSANSASLLKRLNDLETAANYLTYGASTPVYSLLANKDTTSALPPTKISPRDDIRLAVTGESWDLPMPNIALTPRQIQDVVQYVNNYAPIPGATSTLGSLATLNLNNISLVDLARVRIFADNYDPVDGYFNPNFPLLAGMLSAPDTSLFGNLRNVQPNVVQNLALTTPFPVWPLLAPETILGMRLDVNRLLGNGADDNGNGVVDEPAEVLWYDASGTAHGESLYYPYSQINQNVSGPAGQINPITGQANMQAMLDLNDDGFYPGILTPTGPSPLVDPQTFSALPGDATMADTRARQLLAKHLYCLMMLLVDDRPYLPNPGDAVPVPSPQLIMAQIFNVAGPTAAQYWFGPPGSPTGFSTGTPLYMALAALPREQAAYVIAQWAINVVDFRDRDSIMTPFEFDLYPFRADNLLQPNITWNVDDVIDPLGTSVDDDATWRGLVWGCERPELLMTETVAFHDRGTANTNAAGGGDTYYPQAGGDTDYDQVRRPRGSLIVELFNPTSYWDAPQFDLQTNNVAGTPQPWQFFDGNGNQGLGINLAQVANVQPSPATGPLVSPVWRIVVGYSPWIDESSYYNSPPVTTTPPIGGGGWKKSPGGLTATFPPSTPLLDQRAPTLPPGVIHRAVYFAPYQQGFVTGGGVPIFTSTVADTYLSDTFFADPGAFTAGSSALLLPPGQYALVAPATQATPGVGNFVAYAGQSSGPNNGVWSLQMRQANLAYPNNTIASINTSGAPAPGSPYAGAYGVTAATSATIKPAIGVPIQTTWFQTDTNGKPVYLPHAGAVAAAAPSTTLRMSVSEPEHGYPVLPTGTLLPSDDGAYYTTVGTPSAGNTFYTHPFDSAQQNTNPSGATLQFGDKPNPYTAPATADSTQNQPWTQPGYTVLYLQRLANPLQAWEAKLNPYITVDSMPVDLAAYTGETNPGGAPANTPDPITGKSPGIDGSNATPSFDTRRRGYDPVSPTNTLVLDQSTPNIWTPLPTNWATNPYAYDSTKNKKSASQWGNQYSNPKNSKTVLSSPMPLSDCCTLGYVNWEYSNGITSTSIYPMNVYTANSAKVGASGMPAYMYNGDPKTPFPWLAWNNRSYISQYELMLVPASSPASQALDFGMLGWQSAGASSMLPSEYQPATQAVATMLPAAQFLQLLNFFNNQPTAVSSSLMPNLYRIFEFLQVPSRYTGTQDMLNPSQFSGDIAAQVANAATGGGMPSVSHLFHTPFNWLSRYREPGRINLNTIFDPVVFQSLMDDYPGTLFANATDTNPITGNVDAMLWPRGLWASFARSRQGFYEDPRRFYFWGALAQPGAYTVNSAGVPIPNPSAPPNPITQFAFNTTAATPGINADVPTYFANPFRPDGAGAFVPPAETLPAAPGYNRLMHQWHYPTSGLPYSGVNATLLRSQESTAALPGPLPTPPPPPPLPPWPATAAVSSSAQMTALESGMQSSFPMVVNAAGVPVVTTPAPLAQFEDTAFDLNNPSATYKIGNMTSYRNAGQDAAFQYQMFTRLGNTTTNRSNVYAIWITLGKFEVQQVAVSAQNPDGYKLVKPYLDGAGNQVTTRGFYIFDRSVPMGFQRGQDVNIERGMLVERVLQLPQ